MAFDLRAATEAARNEAASKPFEFDWGDEHFVILPMAQWPVEISAEFAELGDANGDAGARVFEVIRQLIGDEDWDRFARTVPNDALLTLLTELAKDQMGGELPDLPQPPGRGSTRTSRPRPSKRSAST